MIKTKALFLDRDGIINVDKSYVFKFSDIVWMSGIIDLIKFANQHNFLVVVLTNQSGIDRGYYKEEDVVKLHQEMSDYLLSKDAKVDDWFYCPDLDSPDRKPNPGMMIKARDKHNIDLSKSIMIGDKESDVLNIDGPTYIIVEGNYNLSNLKDHATLVKNLEDALEVFKKKI
jgi:D-glycero-D-manno-heptose 1,7-bisphosphate phosphatase